MATNKLSIYVNTMVFTIIAGIVSVMLLLVLLFGSDFGTQYAPLIVTIEAGLLLVIIISIVRIYSYERRLESLQSTTMQNRLAIKSCPDYWTMSNESGENGPTCLNNYSMPTEDGGSVSYNIVTGNEYDTPAGTPPTLTQLKLREYDGKPLSQICPGVATVNAPWTELRAACDSFRIAVDT